MVRVLIMLYFNLANNNLLIPGVTLCICFTLEIGSYYAKELS